jgi:hypothetical protein
MKHLKTIGFLLFLIILFPSCVAYHTTPVSLEDAVQEHTKTIIVLKDKSIEKFKYITKDNHGYYGARHTVNGFVNVPINVNEISEVRVKNIIATTIKTGISLGVVMWILVDFYSGWN